MQSSPLTPGFQALPFSDLPVKMDGTGYHHFLALILLQIPKMGITELVLLNHLKEKLGVYLSGYDVAMVTCYVKEMTRTCSPMLRYVFDTIIVVSTDKEWLFCSVKVNLLESDENLGHPL